MNVTALPKALRNTDIYLLDAIMKGYFEEFNTILDAGCGEGRNLPYFLLNNYSCEGIDQNPSSIRLCNMMANSYRVDKNKYNFVEGDIRKLPFNNNNFDIVLSCAVLHFAKNQNDFLTMFGELIRVLKNGGIIFLRMASDLVTTPSNPENNFTFILNNSLIRNLLNNFQLEKIEPVKSVLVEDQRVMTTLLLKKK